jgi:hypothetical protein
LWSISWRKISTWVKDNYDVIASESLRQGEPNQAYRHFAKTLPYSAASIKHGFERRRQKLKDVSECNLRKWDPIPNNIPKWNSPWLHSLVL